MRDCDLRSADLALSNLDFVDFTASDFSRAEFNSTSAARANFSSAKFYKTLMAGKFEGTNFNGADFNESIIISSRFINVNLGNVKNLQKCSFHDHSMLDHRTLFKSGILPDSFYRGWGLPDIFIEYLPSLLNQPIQMFSCFISYSTVDEKFAKRLHADLQAKGIRCWFAPHDMKIGARMREDIDKAIKIYDKILLVLSKNSVRSSWVEFEVENALEQERVNNRTVLFPIRIDSTPLQIDEGWMGHIRRTRNIGDFTKWKNHDKYQESLSKLLKDLKISGD
ncbi:MAG: TIR domain-containing protein [Rhodospirillales bacterium]